MFSPRAVSVRFAGMPTPPYATAPIPSPDMPRGIPYIVGNEAAERFSFYGMKAVLFVFMTEHMLSRNGSLDVMGPLEATFWVHAFNSAVYFFPFFGAILADALLGKYRTIIWLSLVYCLGHLSLAIDSTRMGLLAGLTLIALGAGGIKSCVSAHVGDQFGVTNAHMMSRVFGWFYLAINLGASTSMLLTPKLLEWYGPHVAFAVPGVLMGLATLVFWMGRYRFVHIPAGGMGFLRETFSGEGIRAIGKLSIIYMFVIIFWSVFDQSASTWVEQAKHMDRHWLGFEWSAAQMQAVNPILILVLVPLFGYVLYPAVERVVRFSPLWRICVGMFLASAAAAVPAVIQTWIDAGLRPSIGWQVVGYVLLTSAEVLVSITCLEFSYTQAPKKAKSLAMGVFWLSVSMGNAFTALVNAGLKLTEGDDGAVLLEGASYFWFFAGLALLAAAGFVAVAVFYRERTYIQEEQLAE